IAAEKLGVAGPDTVVLSAPQSPEVAEVLGGGERVAEGSGGIPPELLPGGPGRVSGELGDSASLLLPGANEPPGAVLHEVRTSVVLTGRLSMHDEPGSATRLLVDAAIDRTGIAAALEAARRAWGTIDHAVVCPPDDKDLDGAVAVLGVLRVTFVRLRLRHL